MENILKNKKTNKMDNEKTSWNVKSNIKLLIKNWKFWFKLIIGLLPIISVIIFTSVTLSSTLWFKHHGIFPNNWSPKYHTTLKELQSWSNFRITFVVIFRNLALYTTYSSFIFAAFFINSAFNTLKEGQGRYDNSNVGLLTMIVISFTLIFYNASLPITGDFKLWLPVQWMSMFLQHSVVPILGVIYYFTCYQHHQLTYNKKTMLSLWEYSIAAILGYFLFFTILGYILKATHSWKLMPDMSFSGYFPYDFMEFTDPKASYSHGKIPMAAQTFIAYSIFTIITTGLYFAFYFAQNKISQKQMNSQLIKKQCIKK
ncbi:hypothetical protein [Spiroplasma endosymbiont of Stenodema calcarata]|uniref:hypothetical protein n=1 Tax=Spiroplasma endosymbiont of Stenodema calcarata TaxID=3139328 RepID=UPI003CCAEE85